MLEHCRTRLPVIQARHCTPSVPRCRWRKRASMSKAVAHRKVPPKTARDRNSSSVDRMSDDEPNRRRPCYQMIQRERQQRNSSIRDLDQDNDQLEALREILSKHPHINELIQKCNLSNTVSTKNNAKSECKNHATNKIRPISVRNSNPSVMVNCNQSEEDNLSMNSTEEETLGNASARANRSQGGHDQRPPMIRSASLYSAPNDPRPSNRVSFGSHEERHHEHESSLNSPSAQLRKLLDRLSTELNDLEPMTGFKPIRNDLSQNTCSSALAAALITLTGHVKQCTPTSKGKQDIIHLKDQLSLVIKTQLDFQQKIEHQMTTLQTMMQTICQLVNNEIISNKKYEACTMHHDRVQSETHSRQHWLNNTQRSYNIPKETGSVMGDLLAVARQMRNATPIDASLHVGHNETLPGAKGLNRSPSVTNGAEMSSSMQQRSIHHSEPRSTAVTPINNAPLSYSLFESGLVNGNTSINTLRNEPDDWNGTLNGPPLPSKSDNLLEKILHERLRLMQQMADLNKQHNATQEELADLEARNQQSRNSSHKSKEDNA